MKNPTKEQVKEWNRKYYLKNRDKVDTRNKKWLQDLREWYKELKRTLVCSKCGFSHPAAIAFHHRNPSEKLFDISTMIGKGKSKQKILDEIAKCDVLCHNCHAVHHYQESETHDS